MRVPPALAPRHAQGGHRRRPPGAGCGLAPRQLQQAAQRLQALASLRGYKPGWAIHRFREKFGEAPSASVRASAAPIEDQAEQRRAVYDAMLEEEGGNSAWAAVRFRADTGQSAPRAG